MLHSFKKRISFIYVFILAVLGLCCYTGFSLVVGSGGYSLVVHRLLVMASLEAWLLLSMGSAVVVYELSCSSTCRIFPHQGLNLFLPHWRADSLPLSHLFIGTGEAPVHS